METAFQLMRKLPRAGNVRPRPVLATHGERGRGHRRAEGR